MAFSGWPVAAVEFYEGLQADNSTVYWQDHRAVYERDVRGPMEQLLAELADEFGAGKLFRPYRDVRFSADKTPYKTNCAATLGAGYISLSHEVLKTAPRGIAKDHPRIDLLRHKGIATMKTWPVGAWLGTVKAKERVVTALRAAAPLGEWLTRNAG